VRKTCVAAVVLLCSSYALCQAQMMAENSLPEMPKAVLIEAVKTEVPMRPTHRFFDRRNISLTAMTFSAALADGITTQHALGIHRTTTVIENGMVRSTTVGYAERNPIAAPLVNRGWPGQLAATALTAGADLGLRNWAHRKGHHRIERVIPFLFAATSASFAAHNAKYW
jgi:hypothetical protein